MHAGAEAGDASFRSRLCGAETGHDHLSAHADVDYYRIIAYGEMESPI